MGTGDARLNLTRVVNLWWMRATQAEMRLPPEKWNYTRIPNGFLMLPDNDQEVLTVHSMNGYESTTTVRVAALLSQITGLAALAHEYQDRKAAECYTAAYAWCLKSGNLSDRERQQLYRLGD